MRASHEDSEVEERGSEEQARGAANGGNRHGAKGLRRREEILATARAQLQQYGSGSPLLRSVAKTLEISLGNLQYYFPTREDLLTALFRAESDSDSDLFVSLCAREQTPRDRLAAVTRAFVSRWSQGEVTSHKAVWRALRSVSLQSSQFRGLRHELWERFYEQLSPILRELAPGATASQLRLKAILVTAMIDGTSMMPTATLESLSVLKKPSYEDEAVAAVLWIAEH